MALTYIEATFVAVPGMKVLKNIAEAPVHQKITQTEAPADMQLSSIEDNVKLHPGLPAALVEANVKLHPGLQAAPFEANVNLPLTSPAVSVPAKHSPV
jgi:hypothetical protein